jgi:hypothetical protein
MKMANQKWVASVDDVIIGTFDTKEEAELCEQRYIGRKALGDAINECSDYDGLDTALFIDVVISTTRHKPLLITYNN